MIFVTTGTQLPFPRLVDAMAALAPVLNEDILVQTGPDTTPRAGLDCRASLTPDAFSAALNKARVIVGHAGMGTVLSAKETGKPLIVLPRRFALGEHRNDHQLATAARLEGMAGIYVAWEDEDIRDLLLAPDLIPSRFEPGQSTEGLIARLRGFIDTV